MRPAGRDHVRERRPGAVPEAPLRRSSFLFRLPRLLGFSEHRCPVCGTPVEDDGAGGSGPEAGMLAHGLCPACARALGPYVGGRCRACGLPLPWPAAGQPLLCGDCLTSPPPWQGLALHGQYHGPLRQLILRFKHGGKPALALALGLLLSLPVRPGLLRRPADSPHQTGLTAAQRQRNAAGSFQAADVRGLHLWLVDDIITTGSTLRAASAELRRAGAARVDVLALARTPRP